MARNNVIDWTSTLSQIFINPRLPKPLYDAIIKFNHHKLMGHIWLCSSGTTTQGQVKLIGISKRAMLSAAAGANQHLQSSVGDIWLNTLPRFHVGGLAIYARASLTGARVIDMSEETWSAQSFYSMIQDQNVTLTSLVPTQVYDLVQLEKRCPEHLRAIVVGAAALDPSLYNRARQLGYPVLPSFGMTECGSQVATADLSTVADRGIVQKSFGAVGSRITQKVLSPSEKKNYAFPNLNLLPHIEARTNASGVLELKSPALCSIIYILKAHENSKNSEQIELRVLSEKRIEEGTWFATEDRAQISDRQLVPRGRVSEEIKILGEIINVSDLNQLLVNVLREIEGAENVNRVAVLTVPDSRKGRRPVVVLEKSLWTKAHDILTKWNTRVLPVAKTNEVYFVDRLPITGIGKVATGEILSQIGYKG